MAMSRMPAPITRDLVLIGGGHTHALVLRMWGMQPLPGVRLTLITPSPTAAYSGMLPGFVAGHYALEDLQIDLVKLARFAGARLVFGHAAGIDPVRQRVQVSGRADVAYDIASIDIGITSDMPDLPGFFDHAVPAKPLDRFAQHWESFLRDIIEVRKRPTVAIIGAGLAGVELALAAAHRLGQGAQVTLVDDSLPLRAVGRAARRALLAELERSGVTLAIGTVSRVSTQGLELADGRVVAAEAVIGAAGTVAQGWLSGTGLALRNGFVGVLPTLQSEADPRIFAAGDIAEMAYAPRPKAGVFAVRQAPILFANLRAAALGRNCPKRFRPQRDYLKLVSAGRKTAVADKWGLPWRGDWLWEWKDHIDRKFMAMFQNLPAMHAHPPSAAGKADDKPLCGGCGAKVGRPALNMALNRLPAPQRADVVKGSGDDAAILKVGAGFQVLTTDHLRAFCEDPWLMARITAIHALGDIWSMGAEPQAALAQITLPLMDERRQAETLREIMAAAQEIFGPEGADIVGGHSSMGAELQIGFTVTGLCNDRAICHEGARAGDRVILTKAIGTGVVLAAEMLGKAAGPVVASAYRAMSRPQGAAARLLLPHARAMTDVTGFGLAGHLLSILEASDLSAELDLAAVPVLPGAEELVTEGHGSSLLPANRAARAKMVYNDGPKAELLFDPQTAGGLLAAVPADKAHDLVRQLRDMGDCAAVIATLGAGPASISVQG